MPLFMDVHTIDGPVTIDDVAKAHAADLQAQDEYGVQYLRYWVDEAHGKIFCLVDAPDADAADHGTPQGARPRRRRHLPGRRGSLTSPLAGPRVRGPGTREPSSRLHAARACLAYPASMLVSSPADAGTGRDERNVAMMYGRLTVNPVQAAWNTVARFDDYGSAQRAVDRLSDDGFPVEQLDIVGSDLRLVERVTGRLTRWRAAAAGAVSGMWAGLLIGILFGLFTTGHAWLALVAAGIGLGVLWGGIFGFAAHLATRGERDFSSLRGLTATHYDLVAREGGAERARAELEQAGLLPAEARWTE